MYQNPRTLFQTRINEIVNKELPTKDLFESIFKLQNFLSFEKVSLGSPESDPDGWKTLLEVYIAVGPIQFAKLISIIKGKTIAFPSEEEYQESIITTLCYYYKKLENKSWDEIKEILNCPNLNTIKQGIRVRQLSTFIDQQTIKALTKVSK